MAALCQKSTLVLQPQIKFSDILNKFDSSWYELQRNVSGMSNFNDEFVGIKTIIE